MKINLKRPEESYTARRHRECSERALKNDQIREFGVEEDEMATSSSRFWSPFGWVMTLILSAFDLFKNNLYVDMDESVDIYAISTYDLKRINGKGINAATENGMIILMSMPVMQRKFIAVLKWKGSKADKAKYAHDTLAIAATSTFVTVPPLTITNVGVLATTYGNSSVGTEETAWNNLNNAMIAIMYLFQNFANLNAATAEAAILSGGFECKKVTPRKKQPWSVKNNPVAGVIDLTAGGFRGTGFHDWWISYDGKTFTRLDPTTAAHTQVTGLASNITVYFMHQLITKDGPQGFDAVLKINVD